MGVPTPGQKFNFTKVKDEDIKEYDQIFLDLFQPFNVILLQSRTLTANTQDMANHLKLAMYFVKTLFSILKL